MSAVMISLRSAPPIDGTKSTRASRNDDKDHCNGGNVGAGMLSRTKDLPQMSLFLRFGLYDPTGKLGILWKF